MSLSRETFDSPPEGHRRPSWLDLRVGIPIAVILIGIAFATLWELQFRVLASADVTLGHENFHLQLKEERGWLNGCARSSDGKLRIQRLAALDRQGDPSQPQTPLTRRDVRNARLVVDVQRRQARFVLERATITFDGDRFSLRRKAALD